MKRLLASLPALGLMVVAAPAHANIIGLDLKLGLRGGPGVSVLTAPTDHDDFQTVPYADRYFGVGWNVGGALNLRVLDIVGVEVGAMYSFENMSGASEMDNFKVSRTSDDPVMFKQEFSQQAVHVPLVLQGNVPIGMARPFFSAGVDLVVKRSNRSYDKSFSGYTPPPEEDLSDPWYHATLPVAATKSTLNEDDVATYGGFLAGIGVNVAAPQTEIPLEIRVAYYPSTGSKVSQVFGDPAGSGIGKCGTTSLEAGCGTVNSPDQAPKLRYNDRPEMMVFISFGIDYLAL